MKVPAKIARLLVLPATLLALTPSAVFAEEFVVSGNGSGSSSEVNFTNTTTTTVTQNNDTVVNNDVVVDANSGNNTANANSGDTLIETGNSRVEATVVNEVNSSVVHAADCCNQPIDVQIQGNGDTSANAVSLNQSTTQTVFQNNAASLLNTVNITANTGNNTANTNLGNVTIQTGNIVAQGVIANTNVNVNDVNLGNGGLSLSALINGNGAGSVNTLSANITTTNSVFVNNASTIVNNLALDANTGGNSANGNLGNVTIRTGDILVSAIIGNSTNFNFVDVDCCDFDPSDPSDPADPNDPGDPATTPESPRGGLVGGTSSGGSSSGGNSPTVGSVLAAAVGGMVLPATGSNALLLATIANVIMFLMGLYLRLRSGRSPAIVVRLQFSF